MKEISPLEIIHMVVDAKIQELLAQGKRTEATEIYEAFGQVSYLVGQGERLLIFRQVFAETMKG